MITAADEVVQDPDSVGNAMKTISMRIRGAKTELSEAGESTDGMVESTAKLREEVMALSGVDIMANSTTFKSTFDILDELADKWSTLTDIQQASLIELMAGKNRGNIFAALMSNWETAEKVVQTSLNSEGSALREQEAYSQGIEYSLNRLSASFQTFSNTVFSSDLFKGLIDSGNSFLNVLTEIIDTLGSFQTLAMGFGIFQGIRGTVNQNASGG